MSHTFPHVPHDLPGPIVPHAPLVQFPRWQSSLSEHLLPPTSQATRWEQVGWAAGRLNYPIKNLVPRLLAGRVVSVSGPTQAQFSHQGPWGARDRMPISGPADPIRSQPRSDSLHCRVSIPGAAEANGFQVIRGREVSVISGRNRKFSISVHLTVIRQKNFPLDNY